MKQKWVNFLWSIGLLAFTVMSFLWLTQHQNTNRDFCLLVICFISCFLFVGLTIYTFLALFKKSAEKITSPLPPGSSNPPTESKAPYPTAPTMEKTVWLPTVEWRKIFIALITVPILAGVFHFLIRLTWPSAYSYTIKTVAVGFATYYLVRGLRLGSPSVNRFTRLIRLFGSFCLMAIAIFIPIITYKTGHGRFLEEGISSAFFMFGIFILSFIGLIGIVANFIRFIIGR